MRRSTLARWTGWTLLIGLALTAPTALGVAGHAERTTILEGGAELAAIPASAIGPVYTPAFLLDLVAPTRYACEENLACTLDRDCRIFWNQPTYVCDNPGGNACGGTCIPC